MRFRHNEVNLRSHVNLQKLHKLKVGKVSPGGSFGGSKQGSVSKQGSEKGREKAREKARE